MKKNEDFNKVMNYDKLIGNLSIVLFIFLAIFCSCHIVIWNIERGKVKKEINELLEENIVKEEKIIINPIDESRKDNPKYENDYNIFLNESFLNVDFDKLIKKNKDTVAWLKVNDTTIDYPVVKHENSNEYYLNKSFDDSNNSAGWIFIDYRNNPSVLDNKNTIIYGHGRLDKIMFGSLNKIIDGKWYEESNHIIKLTTPYEKTLWKVFSVYTIKPESYYIKTEFNNKTFNEFVNVLLERSVYDFNETVDGSNNILTLSTCYNNSKRTVVHAKLINKESY